MLRHRQEEQLGMMDSSLGFKATMDLGNRKKEILKGSVHPNSETSLYIWMTLAMSHPNVVPPPIVSF